jgi:hypothetical protein
MREPQERENEAEMAIMYTVKVIFISWMIGHASTLLLRRVTAIDKLLQIKFIGSEKLNKLVGVGICKWVLTNSFIKYFNRRLQISVEKPNLNTLIELREAMSYAEAVHLIGFAYVLGVVLMNIINDQRLSMIAPLFAVNIVANFYPVLVQQMNKRRLGCLIKTLSSREDRD